MWPSLGIHTHLDLLLSVKAKCGPKKTAYGPSLGIFQDDNGRIHLAHIVKEIQGGSGRMKQFFTYELATHI